MKYTIEYTQCDPFGWSSNVISCDTLEEVKKWTEELKNDPYTQLITLRTYERIFERKS